MLNAAQVDILVERNFKDRSVKQVTKDVCRRNFLALVKAYGESLFDERCIQCFRHLMTESGLSVETQKARIVNALRIVRSLTATEFASCFWFEESEQTQEGLVDFLSGLMTQIDGERRADELEKAQDDEIDDKYIPWTWLYNRAAAFVADPNVSGNEDFVLRCKLLAHIMVLDHPPRRNELIYIEFPPASNTLTAAQKKDRNIWDGANAIYINRYKTFPHYGEYVMGVSEPARKILQQLRTMRKSARETRVFPTGTMPDYLSAIVGTRVSVGHFRHSFYTFYYAHPHGQPVYAHERNDISMMTGNLKSHDAYVRRLKPYKNDKMAYYADLMAGRNSNLDEADSRLISEYDATVGGAVKTVGPRITKRTQNELVSRVLKHYSSWFLGKTTEEKRRERPYLRLTKCTDVFEDTGLTVAEILGSDAELVKKWTRTLKV
jgi:hypothetical protein